MTSAISESALRTSTEGRRTALLAAAQEVFSTKGFHEAAMDEIATQAGVSKPILYRFFPSKRDLYLAVVDSGIDALLADITASLADSSGEHDRIQAVVTVYFDRAENADRALGLTAAHDTTTDPDIQTRLDQLNTRVADLLAPMLMPQTGCTRHECELLAAGICAMATGAALRWVRLGRPISREQAIRGITGLAWDGLDTFRN